MKVDYVVSSHPQLDHIEGLVYVVDKFSIGEVWDSGVNSPVSREFKRIVDNKNIREIIIDKNTPDKVIGGCSINFLNPPAEKERLKINNISIVMRILCQDIHYCLQVISRQPQWKILQQTMGHLKVL